LESYLNRYGRGRLIFPIYLALAGNGADQELALKMFERARTAYHPLAESRIARALEPDEVD
ncbi:MAG: leukotriene A4 hydrolase C-terminal domain-containing protein, partial [Gammaproteobacteria bacterium]|nr:leukotriene A4 hydrolase C-terminal domain-containing protein [Gammaproteobacteria bacterium]